MKKLYVANRESGDFIEEVKTVEECIEKIAEYEEQDKKDGIYEANFYEIEDEEHMRVEDDDIMTNTKQILEKLNLTEREIERLIASESYVIYDSFDEFKSNWMGGLNEKSEAEEAYSNLEHVTVDGRDYAIDRW